MSLRLGECQWRAGPSVTVTGRLVMNGPGMRGEDGGERHEATACWVCFTACACSCVCLIGGLMMNGAGMEIGDVQ